MINLLRNNYCTFLSNKTNYNIAKKQNIKLCYRDNISFSGKNFVKQNLFDEKILIPRAVHDAKQSSKRICAYEDEVFCGNAVFLGKGNLFLSISHILDPVPNRISIGKDYYKAKTFYRFDYQNKGDIAVSSPDFDLSIINCDGENGYSRSKPIKIAASMPEINDTVYIIGSNGYFEGQKAIPAKILEYFEKGRLKYDGHPEIGSEASHYVLYSKIIQKNRSQFSPDGLSGSPVVNKNGELIGIHNGGKELEYDGINYQFTEIIDVNTIKKFLESNKIQI